MLIKYTGPKPTKTVEFNDGVYVFIPEAEVTNAEHIKFFFHADRKGLFEKVTETTEEKEARIAKEEKDREENEEKGRQAAEKKRVEEKAEALQMSVEDVVRIEGIAKEKGITFEEVLDQEAKANSFANMKKDQLIAYCQEKGIEINDGMKKDEILEAIENHKE